MVTRLTDFTIDSSIVNSKGQPISTVPCGTVDASHKITIDTWYNCLIDIFEIHSSISRGQNLGEYGGTGCSCKTPQQWIATGLVVTAGIPVTVFHPLKIFQTPGSLQLEVSLIKYQRKPKPINPLGVKISALVSVV